MIERTDAVNHSSLKFMRVSPKHYLWALKHPREDTDALQQGSLTHCMVYEPNAVSSRYVRAPNLHRGMLDATARSKGYDGGKESAAQFDIEVAARKLIAVDPELWKNAEAMAAALHADPHAGPMIRGGFAEQLFTWVDSVTGIECRGRIDHIATRLTDLKTTRCIESRAFANQAVRLDYPSQLSFYKSGLEANGIACDEPPALIAVENEPPYDVAVYEFTEQDLAAGQRMWRSWLDRLKVCRERNEWPGVANNERMRIALPEWATATAEDDEPLTIGGVALI